MSLTVVRTDRRPLDDRPNKAEVYRRLRNALHAVEFVRDQVGSDQVAEAAETLGDIVADEGLLERNWSDLVKKGLAR